LFSCSQQDSDTINDTEYVDVNKWVNAQIESLEGKGLQKRTTWSKSTAADSTYNPDWSNELNDFINLPISPASWKNDYYLTRKTDPQKASSTEILTFASKYHRNKLAEFSLTLFEGELIALDLIFQESTWLKQRNTKLKFVANQGYEIRGKQKTRFFPEESFSIAGTFVAAE